MSRRLIIAVCTTLALLAPSIMIGAEPNNDGYLRAQLKEIDDCNAQGPWKTDWDALAKHEIPEWFQDAKFGIYAHLGVYCVPAFGNEWYPRRMYQKKDAVYKHHVATYGDPSKFGYKDFIPMFTLEKFDAAEWANLYQAAGARFAGPVAEHHDGFSMWASQVNRWNAGAVGPKRDVAGALIREIRKRGMKTIASFHHAFNIQGYYTPGDGWDTADPKYADLYGFPGRKDRKLAYDRWLVKLKEVVDQYQPDQVWFDFGLGKVPEDYKKRFAAYYYNHEKTWGKPLIITRKDHFLPDGVGALDIERGRMKDAAKEPWQTDDATAYNSWCWVRDLRVKPPEEMVHELIDIVSKNGILLLNVCPKGDGTISPDQKSLLHEIGRWLKVNGEAIYATRPWLVFGEGPTRMKKGGAFLKTIKYQPSDIRYTQSKDGKTLFAIVMGWPDNPVILRSVRVIKASPDAQVTLLGYTKPLPFQVDRDGTLKITVPALTPEQRPGKYAYALKLVGFQLGMSEIAEEKK